MFQWWCTNQKYALWATSNSLTYVEEKQYYCQGHFRPVDTRLTPSWSHIADELKRVHHTARMMKLEAQIGQGYSVAQDQNPTTSKGGNQSTICQHVISIIKETDVQERLTVSSTEPLIRFLKIWKSNPFTKNSIIESCWDLSATSTVRPWMIALVSWNSGKLPTAALARLTAIPASAKELEAEAADLSRSRRERESVSALSSWFNTECKGIFPCLVSTNNEGRTNASTDDGPQRIERRERRNTMLHRIVRNE